MRVVRAPMHAASHAHVPARRILAGSMKMRHGRDLQLFLISSLLFFTFFRRAAMLGGTGCGDLHRGPQ